MEEKWVSVCDFLPISGPQDDKFNPPYHEEMVEVITIGGGIKKSIFAAGLDYTNSESGAEWPYKFVMVFDEPCVTHWRKINE